MQSQDPPRNRQYPRVSKRTRDRCPALVQLLGGVLHQDFDLEYPSAEAALADAVGSASLAQLRDAAVELRRHRPSRDDEVASRAFANDLCDYHPLGDGLTYGAWLDHLQDVLDEAVQT
jgi:hypothetical protein